MFRFEYQPGTIRYGAGSVTELSKEIEALDAEHALLVTGQTVGTTSTVMDPVRDGLGESLIAEFAKTTPEKQLETAIAGAVRVSETNADIVVALGGGSSLDIAKIITVITASTSSPADIRAAFTETGTIAVPDDDLLPIVAIPTTLAGADLSMVGGITTRNEDGLVRGGAYDAQLMPSALVYDPDLFRTTPHHVLCASAMNGFDKAIETVYARTATPITDGTAVEALQLLTTGLPALGTGDRDETTMHNAVVGTILAQYGCSRPDGLTLSLIHAFGHGIARGYDIQQGGAHGIIAPHALRYLFTHVDGARNRLAAGFGIATTERTPEETAIAVVDAVEEVRDALDLPSQLRAIPDMTESDLPAVARDVHTDGLLPYCPDGIDPTVDDLLAVLREAW